MNFWSVYLWTFVGGASSAAALALIGAHLAARNQSVQALVMSQGAGLGVVLALALRSPTPEVHTHSDDVLPLIFGAAASAAAFFICEGLVRRRWPARNAYFIGLFCLLMALSYTLVAMVPRLESHMAASYFGDLTLASEHEQIVISTLALLATLYLLKQWRVLTSWSFDSVTFGSFIPTRFERRHHFIFLALTMILVSASVHFLGLLFTLASLFIPSLVIGRLRRQLSGVAWRLALGAAVSVVSGMSISLSEGHLPTVPTIAMMLVVCSVFVALPWRTK